MDSNDKVDVSILVSNLKLVLSLSFPHFPLRFFPSCHFNISIFSIAVTKYIHRLDDIILLYINLIGLRFAKTVRLTPAMIIIVDPAADAAADVAIQELSSLRSGVNASTSRPVGSRHASGPPVWSRKRAGGPRVGPDPQFRLLTTSRAEGSTRMGQQYLTV